MSHSVKLIFPFLYANQKTFRSLELYTLSSYHFSSDPPPRENYEENCSVFMRELFRFLREKMASVQT